MSEEVKTALQTVIDAMLHTAIDGLQVTVRDNDGNQYKVRIKKVDDD